MLSRIAGICLLFWTFAPSSFACSCGVSPQAANNPAAWRKKEVKQLLKSANAVFQGTLVKIEYKDPERTARLLPSLPPRPVPRRFVATFQVHEQWKGEPAESIEIYTREPGSDCIGFSGSADADYVIFAFRQNIQPSKPNVWVLLEWNDILPIGQSILRMEEGCGRLSGNVSHQEVQELLPLLPKRKR